MLYPANVLTHFDIGIPGIIFIKHWIKPTRKHHILPNHDAVLVSELIKPIIEIDSTSPDSQKVIVGFFGRFEQPLQLALVEHAGGVVVYWHHVRPF